MCRWAPSSSRAAQQRRAGAGGVALAALGRVGPQQRRERGHLDGQVRARQRAARVALQRAGARASRAWRAGERRRAPRRSARRSARPRPAVTVASPSRSTVVATPPFHRSRSSPSAAFGRLADDEAVRHVLDAGGGGGAQRGAARARVAHAHRARRRGGGGSSTSPRKPVRWRARSSSERQAGTTSTKRNSAALQLRVAGGQLHRLLVQRPSTGCARWRATRPPGRRPTRRTSGSSAAPARPRPSLASLNWAPLGRADSARRRHARYDDHQRAGRTAAQRRRARCTTRRTWSRPSTTRVVARARRPHVRADRRRRRLERRHAGDARAARRDRRAPQGRHAVAQLRPPDRR